LPWLREKLQVERLDAYSLTADTASERSALPKAASLGGCLLLADRGYFDRDYLVELIEAGASFIIRAPQGLNPLVLDAYNAQDKRLTPVLWQAAQGAAYRKERPGRPAGALEAQG
jgi:ankyrin repeat protein